MEDITTIRQSIEREGLEKFPSKEQLRISELMNHVPAVRMKYPSAVLIEPIILWYNSAGWDLLTTNLEEAIGVIMPDGESILIDVNTL